MKPNFLIRFLVAILISLIAYPSQGKTAALHAPRVAAKQAIDIAFRRLNENANAEAFVQSAQIYTISGAELRVILRGLKPTLIRDDRLYWNVDINVSATTANHSYTFTAIIDSDTGEILE